MNFLGWLTIIIGSIITTWSFTNEEPIWLIGSIPLILLGFFFLSERRNSEGK